MPKGERVRTILDGVSVGDDDADDIVFDALWTGVVNGWKSAERHDKFLDQTRRMHAFTEAARRYGALKDDPDRGAEARKRLAAIALLATHELLVTKTPTSVRKTPGWVYVVTIVVCVGLLGWATYYAFGMGR